MNRQYFVTTNGIVCGFCGHIQCVLTNGDGSLFVDEVHSVECAPELVKPEEEKSDL